MIPLRAEGVFRGSSVLCSTQKRPALEDESLRSKSKRALWNLYFLCCSRWKYVVNEADNCREENMFSRLRRECSPGELNRIPALATDFLCDTSHFAHVVVNCVFLGAWYGGV